MQLKEQSYSQCSSFACSCEFIQPARGLDRVWINAIYQERLRHQVYYSSLIMRIQLYTSLFSNHFGNILGKYDLMHMSAFTWRVSVKPGLCTGLDSGLDWTGLTKAAVYTKATTACPQLPQVASLLLNPPNHHLLDFQEVKDHVHI